MSPLGGHPDLIEWILEESSTGFRRNDIYFGSIPLPARLSFTLALTVQPIFIILDPRDAFPVVLIK